jgi:hypothetical protein
MYLWSDAVKGVKLKRYVASVVFALNVSRFQPGSWKLLP